MSEFLKRLGAGETVTIGKLLPHSTVTKTMLEDMFQAALRGEVAHFYFDGDAVRVEHVDTRLATSDDLAADSASTRRK